MVTRRAVARAGLLLAGVIAAAAGIALACGTGDLSDLTAGRDSGFDAADAAPPICVHAAPPAPPTTTDSPNGPDLTFGIGDLRLDDGEHSGGAEKPQGLDLDHRCTCAGPVVLEGESCVPPPDAGKRLCDGDAGRDNVAGTLLAVAASLGSGIGSDVILNQLRSGSFTAMITLQGWNHQPDDPHVIVSVLLSSGTEGSQTDGGRATPKFDGTDVWTVSPDSLLGGNELIGKDCRALALPCVPAKPDVEAYVKDNVVVAHIDLGLPVIIEGGTFQIDFIGATLLGTLLPENGSYRLAGEITGRWPVGKMLSAFAGVKNPRTGTALCATDAGLEVYGLVKNTICTSADLTSDPTLDNTGARCDALSNAIAFSAPRATVGTVYRRENAVPTCPGFTDSCPK